MEKITVEKATEIVKKIEIRHSDANPFYLASNCYIDKKNGEEIIYDKDVTDGKIKPFFLPKKEINMTNQLISCAFEKDLEQLDKLGIKIKIKTLYGYEYIHKTEDFIKLEGSEFRSFRKAINQFKKLYPYKLLGEYPKEKIVEFLLAWKKEKNLKATSPEAKKASEFEYQASLKWLDLLDKIPNNRIFIEIDDKLVAFAVFLKLKNDFWVNLMQKTDHHYKGISRFLYNEKAKVMKDIEFFSTGIPGDDTGLVEFKDSMRPIKKVPIYVIETGNKVNNK